MTDVKAPLARAGGGSPLDAVRGQRARFEAAARPAEEERTLPADVVELLRELRLFWLKTPSELGGGELDPLAFCDVLEELAYYDASVAWATMVGNGTTGVVAGWLPEDGVRELFPDSGEDLPVCAGQFTPRGKAVEVDGGYRVTGRWSFCSGINHSQWVVGGCLVDGRPDGGLLAMVVPKAEATLHDTWYAAGLQGTGSGDFSLSDVFVPAARAVDLLKPAGRRGGELYNVDPLLFVSNELGPVVVGIARRAVDDMVEMAGRTARGAGVALSERAAFLKTLSRSASRLRAVQLLYRTAVEETWATARSGSGLTEAVTTRLRAQHNYVVEECVDLVGDLFRYGGGRVLLLDHPMQRHLRNLTAAAQHVYVVDENYELAGRAMLADVTG